MGCVVGSRVSMAVSQALRKSKPGLASEGMREVGPVWVVTVDLEAMVAWLLCI